ncbi:hypothetical protein [Bradyrhizobium sp. AZCC 1693]|uniref:hypothetical protein n=1 Tax=Bradyrhizobium sp. AZCC 1693 TaxID=3117029 RepID=UPI002FF1CDC7
MIDSHQASSALADITEIGRRVRQSLFYQRASSMLMLWGAVTFIGYSLSFGVPSAARLIWIAAFIVGIGGSVAVGALTRKRDGINTFDARKLAAFLVFTAFGCMWIVVGHFTGRQIGAFWTTYFMLPYILVGLWVGWALVAIGSTVMTLTLIGYFFSGGWFDLWMALVNGIGLVIGGFWMRRS